MRTSHYRLAAAAPSERGAGGERFGQLTSLRGISSAMVFWHHFGHVHGKTHAATIPASYRSLWHALNTGPLGVMVFFVLSGFLMGHHYLNLPCTRRNVARFACSRAGRVLPLYYAMLAIHASVLQASFFSGWSFSEPCTGVEWLLAASLIHAHPFKLTPMWTIPVEVQFYVVFVPAWFVWRRTVLRRLACVALLLAYCLALLDWTGSRLHVANAMTFFRDEAQTVCCCHRNPSCSPAYLPAFGAGVVCGVYFVPMRALVREAAPRWGGLATQLLAPAFLAALLLNRRYLFRSPAPASSPFDEVFGDPSNWLIVPGAILGCAGQTRATRALEARWLTVLGELSYGIYMLHYPVIVACVLLLKDAVDPPLLEPLTLLSSGAATGLLAWLSLHWFERPCQAAMRPRCTEGQKF